MKDYFKNWNIMRVIRFALGIFIIVQGINTSQWPMVALGGLFSIMPLFNLGCCTTTNCSVPKYRQTRTGEEPNFEEVK